MKIRLVLLSVAVVLTVAVNGCPVGREFLTAFMANFNAGFPHAKLQLAITAYSKQANVKVEVKEIQFSRTVKVKKWSTEQVVLPSSAEMQGSELCRRTVQITSNFDISVVTFNNKLTTGDSSIVFPISDLDTKYMIYTPNSGPADMDKLVVIINAKDETNKVKIDPIGDISLKGTESWKKNGKVIIEMGPYEVIQLRSTQSFTGTQLKASHPVAVLAGQQCSQSDKSCTHVFQQLLPIRKLSTNWMVPIIRPSEDVVHVMAIKDKTKIEVFVAHTNKTFENMQAGQILALKVNGIVPVILKSDKKVMVILSSGKRNPAFISIVPELSNVWSIDTQGSVNGIVVIICEKSGIKSVKLNGKKLPKTSNWIQFTADDSYRVTLVHFDKKLKHLYITSDVQTAVFLEGSMSAQSYITAGVCYPGSPPHPPPDPCESVKCKKKEKCRKGVCVPSSAAICSATGDPHYITLDGKRFDFQGTCTYIMSTTVANDKGLIAFTILAKNNNRGRKYVSFVRKVTIMVYNQTITIGAQKGKVLVNGVNCNLPVTLSPASGGKVRVGRRKGDALMRTDFGLKVRYDWNSRLYITVPSSYSQSVGGLCGNYNGDRKDEFTTPEGKLVSTAKAFAKSWKTEDGDIFCNDDCQGECPSCPPALQEKYRSEDSCGLMEKTDGPFASCHESLEPDTYVNNCVFDVCVNKGIKRFLCENMESYASACNAEGVKLTGGDWREQANCPMDCPVNSHYDSCATACPASCGDLDIADDCESCVAGCQCDEGFVLSGEKCVPKTSCGCSYNGMYFEPEEKFWDDNECTRICTCNPKTSKVECSEGSCKKKEVCDLRDGVRECYPASFATCKGTGDPHYTNFDGTRYDFQGTCYYYLSKVISTNDPGLVPFEVLVKNENRGGKKKVSYTKSVEFKVYGNTIIMSKEWPGKVLVNGQFKHLPFKLEDGKLSADLRGKFGTVKTDFRLMLKFNWESHVRLILPSSYSGDVGGLCGNMNGNRDDDMVTPDNKTAETPTEFGNSWKARDDPGCTDNCGGSKCPKCDPSSELRYKQKELCGMISDPQGPFKACHIIVDPVPHLQDCVYDMCMYSGHVTALCSALTDYTTACHDASAAVDQWRSDSFCPASCKENSRYNICTTCIATCSELLEPTTCEESSCQEGCECDDGFLLSDGECVPVAECGCMHNGQYYQSGQVFFPDGQCKQRCVCQDTGTVQCDSNFSCGPNEKCQIKDGVQSCFPAGTGTCSVFGRSSYVSFDSKTFDLSGDCTYVLAEFIPEDEGNLFSVSVKQESIAGEVPVTRSVGIKINEYKITFSPAIWEAMVNGIRMNLPLFLNDGEVTVHQNGLDIVLHTNFGLRVSYDGTSSVIIEVPSTYKGATRGLCSNYNDRPDDDLTLPNGSPAPSIKKFAEAWVVLQEGVACQTGSDLNCLNSTSVKKSDAEAACNILISNEGPFSRCHEEISPQKYFNECVREIVSCQMDDTLCRHLQRYVASCQATGVTIGEWRTENFCPIECPPRSHYELCADTCSSTCASLSVSTKCASCREGCQCDDGFVFDGGMCVPLDSCGCMENGRYYKSGESVLLNDCTKMCSCHRGVLSCNDTFCSDDEFCEIDNGVLGCYKGLCEKKKCREKEHCIVEDENPVCEAQSSASCWVMGDPYYQTFDGNIFGFQGTCSYTLVRTNGKDQTLPAFSIETRNSMRGNSQGSSVKSVHIELLGHEIDIPYLERGKLLIDGISSDFPARLESGRIEITLSGIKGTLWTDFGVEVVFDWISMLLVRVTSSYYDNLEGLCGTYNDVQEDDFTMPSGKVEANTTEWGRSWAVDDGDPSCRLS